VGIGFCAKSIGPSLFPDFGHVEPCHIEPPFLGKSFLNSEIKKIGGYEFLKPMHRNFYEKLLPSIKT
jgi:hypothetical protein